MPFAPHKIAAVFVTVSMNPFFCTVTYPHFDSILAAKA